jgi:dihydroorotate dehydrogenase electron transfer subunit
MNVKKLIQDFLVVKNIFLNSRHFILELQAPEPLPEIFPGQFVDVLVENSASTFLRRPFSIYSVNYSENVIRLLVQVRGEGTKHLGQLREKDQVNLIFPLGKPFTTPESENVLLVGGGVGIAPLMFLSQHLNTLGMRPDIVIGSRTNTDLFEMDLFRNQCRSVFVTTEDGSEGEKGFVTQHSVFKKEPFKYERIYCCGPDPMMHAVSKLAEQLGTDCEVSLENFMACGFGVCLCCITPTIYGNQRSCVEGPVFNTKALQWK